MLKLEWEEKNLLELSKTEIIKLLKETTKVNQLHSTAVMMLWDALTVVASKGRPDIDYSALATVIKSVEHAYIKDIDKQMRQKELTKSEASFLVNNVQESSLVIWETFLSVVPQGDDIRTIN